MRTQFVFIVRRFEDKAFFFRVVPASNESEALQRLTRWSRVDIRHKYFVELVGSTPHLVPPMSDPDEVNEVLRAAFEAKADVLYRVSRCKVAKQIKDELKQVIRAEAPEMFEGLCQEAKDLLWFLVNEGAMAQQLLAELLLA